MHSLVRLLEEHGAPDAPAKISVVLALFVVASLVSRLATILAQGIHRRGAMEDGVSPLVALSRRETALSLVQTTVRYVVFLIAFTLAVVVLTGGRAIGTVAGASFLAVMVGFAAQRFLIDLMAGFVMFFEGWYTVGTSIVIEPMKLEGVVEEVSLRATTIRDVGGELIRVNNSSISAVRVLPEGARRVQIELFVHDDEAGSELVERVSTMVPTGPTAFLEAPHVRRTEALDEDLHRVTAEASVAAGRMWLAEDLLPALLKERAGDGLIVHGPVVLRADAQATTRFARAVHRRRRARR